MLFSWCQNKQLPTTTISLSAQQKVPNYALWILSSLKDNVMVEVDITLSFTIFDPESFVYKLGATHFGTSIFTVKK